MIEVIRSLVKTSKNGGYVVIPSDWLKHLKIKGIVPKKMKLKIYNNKIVLYPIN